VFSLRLNYNDYSYVAGIHSFLNLIFINLRSISDQLIVVACTSNITKLPILMPMARQEFVFWIGDGDREECK
jgi:hypothetical protein